MTTKPKRQRGRPKGTGKPLKPAEDLLTEEIYFRVTAKDKAIYEALGRREGPEYLRQKLREARL